MTGSAHPGQTGATPAVPIRWIASYPKSGNTWVRFLLFHYFKGKASSSVEISRFIPGMQAKGEVEAGEAFDGMRLIKTHSPFLGGLPGVGSTAGFIYVVRHPRDVILSCLHWVRLTNPLPPSQQPTDEQVARAFIHLGGAPAYIQYGFGTWESHYRSWLDQKTVTGLVVRYEDLHTQPAREVARMVEYLGHTPDAARIDEAVALSTFEHMRELEVSEKTSGGRDVLFGGGADRMKKGLYFMNKGQSGRSLESIAPGLDRAVEERFAEAIRRFGY